MFRVLSAIVLITGLAASTSVLGATPQVTIPTPHVINDGGHHIDQTAKQSTRPGTDKSGRTSIVPNEGAPTLGSTVLIGLLVLTGSCQLILLSFQLLVTGKAANAAKRASQLTEKLVAEFETPFLFPVLVSSTIFEDLRRLEGNPNPSDTPSSRVAFTVKNFGRTPALMQKAAAVLFVGDVDEGRNDLLSARAAEFMLEPQGSIIKPFEREIARPIDKDTLESLKEARTRLFLRGRITFLDVLGNRFEQTFCFTWDMEGGAFIPWGPHRNRRRRIISKRKKLA